MKREKLSRKPVNILLDTGTLEKAEEICIRTADSMSSIIRRLIREEFHEKRLH